MEYKQNAFRELRKDISGIWGRSKYIYYFQGARDHRPPEGASSLVIFLINDKLYCVRFLFGLLY